MIHKFENVLSKKDFEDFRHVIDMEGIYNDMFDLEKISQYPIYKICKDYSQSLFGAKDFYATGTYRQLPDDDSVGWHKDGEFIVCIFYLHCPKEGGETEFKNGTLIKPIENRLIVYDGEILEHRVRDTKERRQTYQMRFNK